VNPLDRSLLTIFSAEQAEHLASIRTLLAGLKDGAPSAQLAAIEELLRHLHTLKGAARAVGLEQTEILTHGAEEYLADLRREAAGLNEDALRVISRTADAIEDILAAAVASRNAPDCSDLFRQLGQVSETPSQTPIPATRESAEPAAAPDLLRVHARNLDELIRNAADLLIDATAEDNATHLDDYVARLEDTAAEWLRLRRASFSNARTLASDPEFRPVATCLSFMDSRMDVLRRASRRTREDLSYSSRSSRAKAGAVHRAACRLRMTPAESVFGVFGPMVRDLAHQEGREVVFEAEGLNIDADLLVLQNLKDPVMHLLRNAVSHGIESPQERINAGKTREGIIRLLLASRGDRLELSIEDDGRGINYKEVEMTARDQGVLAPGETVEHSETFGRLIFRAGFSTSKAVTGISGRGMGLAIVDRAVRRLHGGVGLYPRAGGGTRVVLSTPISISTQHVLLVSVGGHTFGIATAYVDTVLRVPQDQFLSVGGRQSVPTEAGPVPLRHLASLLRLSPVRDENDTALACAVLILNGSRMAFAVDRLLDEREATIKDTGLPDSGTGLTGGAIPMEDGAVAVMLNVNALFDAAARTARTALPVGRPAPAAKQSRKHRIMVVDDSLTTRSLEKSILEANGYEVKLAVDGLEAFDLLRLDLPDLVISDVSMPRMTGFQLLEQMKKDEKMKKVPVILVTSLESKDEQHLGLSLGADAYIIKRKFDQRELLNVIREIL
jgi:two-component system, chemotaxis family, sensor kinase CheA